MVARAGFSGTARVWRSHARGRAPVQAPHRCTLACDIHCGGRCEQQQKTDTGSRRTIRSAAIKLLPEASEWLGVSREFYWFIKRVQSPNRLRLPTS